MTLLLVDSSLAVYVCVCVFCFLSTHDKRAYFSYDLLLVSFVISLNKHNSYLSLCVHCVYTELQIMDTANNALRNYVEKNTKNIDLRDPLDLSLEDLEVWFEFLSVIVSCIVF